MLWNYYTINFIFVLSNTIYIIGIAHYTLMWLYFRSITYQRESENMYVNIRYSKFNFEQIFSVELSTIYPLTYTFSIAHLKNYWGGSCQLSLFYFFHDCICRTVLEWNIDEIGLKRQRSIINGRKQSYKASTHSAL